jgi:hypothetical protein
VRDTALGISRFYRRVRTRAFRLPSQRLRAVRGEPPVFTGITPSSRSASRTRDRASTSSTARARALAVRRWRGTRHATRTLERARAHLCASPTSRRHDFYRRRRRIDGFASSITGASAFFSSSLDRAPSAPSVFARLGTHTPLSARLPTAVNGHDPAEPPSARRSTCCRRIAPRPRAGGKPPRRASARATPRMSSRSRAKPRGRCGRSYTPRSSSEETTCARWRSRSPP